MPNDFETHQIHFRDREGFNDALLMGFYPDDIGHADCIFTFYLRNERDAAHERLVAEGISCTADS
jgi:hypothetical protein